MNRSKQQALLLLTFAWLCFMGARAGSVVVDATRTFQVGQNLKDLQDPPLVLSAQITDSTIVDLTDVRVGLHLVGNPSGQGFASEIFVSLNKDLAVTSILLNQVGLRTGNPVGFGYDGWNVTFSDSASEGDVHLNDFGSGIMTGEIQPDGRLKPEDSARPATLAILKGQTANGTWRLNVADLEFGGSMRLESWSLTLTGRNNRAPYFVGLTDVTIPESAAYTLPLVARDADIPAQPLTVELVEGPEGSTVVNGAFRWTPPETAGGTTQSVRVRVSDGVDSTTASFQVVVTEANTPPAFTGLTDFILDDLSPFSRTLVATDSDLPAQTLTYRLVGGPDGAELVDNVFQWTPIEEQRPSTNIVLVAVSDGLVSVTNQFTLFLPNYNTAPVIEAVPNKTVNEGVSLGFNLSAQDADYPPNVLTYSLVSGPPGMTVSAAGRVRWVPTEEQGPGVYEATVQVVDDGFPALSASQTFTVTVLERNLEPELAAIPNMTIEEVQPLVLALTATDADLPVQNLEFNLISGPEGMTVSAAGLLEWTPTESQGPGTYVVRVRVTDSYQLTAEQEFNLEVLEVPAAPVLPDLGTLTIPEMVAWTQPLGGSDSDLPTQQLTYTLVSGPEGLTLTAEGQLKWTPTEAQGPGTYTAKVQLTDDSGLSTEREYSIQVQEANRGPVLSSISAQSLEEGQTLTLVLQAVDRDLPANVLSYKLVSGPQGMTVDSQSGVLTWKTTESDGPSTQTVVVEVSDDAQTPLSSRVSFQVTVSENNQAPVLVTVTTQSVVEGVNLVVDLVASDADLPANTLRYRLIQGPTGLKLNSITGRVEWTPTTTQGPATYDVTVEAYDNGDPVLSVSQTFQVVVIDSNRAPVASNQELQGTEEVNLPITLQASDADGDTVTYTVVTPPQLGVLTGKAPNLTYIPKANANGRDQFTFVAKDRTLESEPATVVIQLAPINDAPVASGQQVSVVEDSPTPIVLTASDVDGDSLTYTIVAAPSLGTLSGAAPNLIYTPKRDATGADQFTYRVNDGKVDSGFATVYITIAPVNDAPVAQAQEVAATEDTAVSITLRGNDTEGDALTYKVVSGPKLGVLSGIAPNLVYTPNANANGTDQFTFRVKDGVLESGEATVNITIAAVNDAPLAGGLAVQTTEDTAVSLVLAASDVDGDVLNYTVVSGPKLGVLSGTAPNLVYTPNANANGTDQFTFKVKDGILESTEATVRITIAPVNDAPVANGLAIQTTEDTAVPVVLKASDVDGDALTYTVVSGPKSGVLSGTAPQLIYTPNPNINGADQFTFRVKDGALESSLATVNITIAPINDAPVVAPILNQVLASGAALSLPLDATDVDVPSQTLTFSLKSGPSGMTLNSGNTLVWLPKGSQRPSTNRVVVGVTDGIASAETSFEIVAKAAEQVTLFSGVAIDGYIAGARVWFDANLNGIQDPEEPTTTTDRTGGFNLDFDSSRFDRNSNGKLESSEGRLVVEGGVDLSSGQTRVGQLVAPPGASVVTPLTTMVDLVSRQAGGLSAAAAEDQVRKALGLPVGISLTQYNPIDAAVKGDPSAAAVQVVSAAVADTIALMASVIDQAAPGVNAAQASALVSQALAEKLATSAQVDLKSSSLLSQTITAAASAASTVLSTQVTEAVSQVVAEQNATKQALVEKAANPLEALQAISQVQAVVHGAMVSSLGELGSGKTSADEVKLLYTGTALVESIAAAPVGDVTGTNVQPGLFEFSSATAVGVEDGRAVQPLSVLRKGGAYGKVQLTVRLSGDSMLLRTNVIMLEFEDGMTQQALDFKGILKDDASPQADRTITATLSLGGTPPAGTGLGGVTQSSIRVLDNDSAGSIGFVTAKYTGLEGDPVLVELERVNGTAGLIVAEIRLSGGTASLGSDYRSVQVPVTFASGQSRALIDVGWLDDGVYEFMESVNLSLTLSSGSAPGASLISGRSVAILEVNEKPSVNRSPVLAGVDDVRTPWGTAVVLLLQGTDPDVPKDHLTYSMISGPEALKIDAETGLLEWTPEPTDAGKDFDITVRVTDSGFPPLKAEQVFRITVTAKPVANRPPVFSAIPDQLLKPGVNWRLTPVATDPDLPANSLTYRLVSGPAGLRMDSLTGVLEWKPSEADAGNSYEVLIEVSDNGKPPQSSRQAFKLRVAEVEIAPLLEIQVLEASSNLELKVIGTRRSTLRILSSYDLKTWTPYGEVLMTSSAMTISVPVEGASQFFRLQEAP